MGDLRRFWHNFCSIITRMKRIAVYCSASDSVPEIYRSEAYRLGVLIGEAHLELIYGDGGIGLMAQVADGVLSTGGTATGVIPQFMVDRGWHNPKSTHRVVTTTMHERKAYIAKMADAMVALPGGIGTFEELIECLTWKQLGLHGKPVIIVNTNGYYDYLLAALDRMVSEHFMQPLHRDSMFQVVKSADEVLPALAHAPVWTQAMRDKARS